MLAGKEPTMTHILTLTFNPALDISTTVPHIQPSHKLRCTQPVVHPGGGGINVARVLKRLGADVRAVLPSGGPTGASLVRLLQHEGVPLHVVPISQDTRESFSAVATDTGEEYRFVLPGPTLRAPEWQACLDACLSGQPAYLVASGSLCPGMPDDTYALLAEPCQAQGTRLVVDSSGPALQAALKAGVFLFKPSLRELKELTGAPLSTTREQLDACRGLIQTGQAEIVALTLGEAGAMVVSANEAWMSPALPVAVHSTIGAGDSFVAGLVWSLAQGEPLRDAFRLAMAASAAALAAQGTALCDPANALSWRGQVQPQALSPA